MKSLLRGPFFPDPKITVISFAGKGLERMDVKRPKILVGLSLSLPDEDVYDPSIHIFPAVVDTGCNASFQLDARHLFAWAGMIPTHLDLIHRRDRPSHRSFEVRRGLIWLHRNPYTGPRFHGPLLPHPLTETDEILVMDTSTTDPDPRFPLLGLDALVDNGLILSVNGASSEFELFAS